MQGQRTCSAEDCGTKHYAHGWCRRHYQANRSSVQARTCSAPSCDEGHYAKGFCRLHWQRERRSGDARVDAPRRAWGQQGCSLPGCDEPHAGKGYCSKHLRRFNKYGDPHRVEKPLQGRHGGEAGYTAAHERIYRMRGPANSYACQRCGQPADEWAYDHNDLDVRHEPGKGPYSNDPTHYLPLCHSCHRKLDHNGWN